MQQRVPEPSGAPTPAPRGPVRCLWRQAVCVGEWRTGGPGTGGPESWHCLKGAPLLFYENMGSEFRPTFSRKPGNPKFYVKLSDI